METRTKLAGVALGVAALAGVIAGAALSDSGPSAVVTIEPAATPEPEVPDPAPVPDLPAPVDHLVPDVDPAPLPPAQSGDEPGPAGEPVVEEPDVDEVADDGATVDETSSNEPPATTEPDPSDPPADSPTEDDHVSAPTDHPEGDREPENGDYGNGEGPTGPSDEGSEPADPRDP